jgi:hypothetical protein
MSDGDDFDLVIPQVDGENHGQGLSDQDPVAFERPSFEVRID